MGVKDSQTKQLGKNSYTVFPLGAKAGIRVFSRLTKIVGSIVKSGGGTDDKAAMIAEALSAVSDDDLEFFCNAFSSSTTVNNVGLPGIFEAHFSQNYVELIQWLLFCVEVNYSGFFDGAGKDGSGLLGAVKAPQ